LSIIEYPESIIRFLLLHLAVALFPLRSWLELPLRRPLKLRLAINLNRLLVGSQFVCHEYGTIADIHSVSP
ncbi:MAG: hypothetical protein C4294_03805, partial [Nitrospiraceae bacterium]